MVGSLEGYGFQGTVKAGDGSNQKGVKMGAGYVKKEKAAEEGGTQRGKPQLEPSGTSGLCLGIIRHLFDKTHALFVQ